MTSSDEFGKKAQDSRPPAQQQPPQEREAPYDDRDLEAARLEVLRRQNAATFDLEKRGQLGKAQLEKKAQALAPEMAKMRRQAAIEPAKELPGQSALPNEEKRVRFAKWEIMQRNALEKQHLDAKRLQDHAQARRRGLLEQQLRQLNERREQDLAALTAINERHQKGSVLSRGIDKLRGIDQQRAELEMNIESAERTIKTNQEGLARLEVEKDNLRRYQERETQSLDQQIERYRAAGYEIPNEQLSRDILHNPGDRGRER
jgi:hypothetical protein